MMTGMSTLANHCIMIFVFQITESNFKYSRSIYALSPVTTQSIRTAFVTVTANTVGEVVSRQCDLDLGAFDRQMPIKGPAA